MRIRLYLMEPDNQRLIGHVLRKAGAQVNLCMGPWTNHALFEPGAEHLAVDLVEHLVRERGCDHIRWLSLFNEPDHFYSTGSALNRATLAHTRFHEMRELQVVAIHRAGKAITAMPAGIQHVPLRIGDVLLIQGSAHAVGEIKAQPDMMVLDATRDLPRRRKASLSLLVMFAVILLATTRLLPLPIIASLG